MITRSKQPPKPITPVPNIAQVAQVVKFSVRIFSDSYPKGKVTSLTIRKNLMILWVLFGTRNFSFDNKKGLHDRIETQASDFIYKCLEEWPYDDGKGLSDFVMEKMAEDFLDKKNFRRYKQLMRSI